MRTSSKAKQGPENIIKVVHAALADGENESIILRGVIDPASLSNLQVDKYQRDIHSRKHTLEIIDGLSRKGSVPDIELGMRGHSYTESGDTFFLHDPVFIVDGYQRTDAALEMLRNGIQPRIGAMIHFDTTYEWEKDRFEILNVNRIGVSKNILIRNMADDNKAIALLKQLSCSSSFALCNRIAWQQKMRVGELINVQMLLKTSAWLHRRFGKGLIGSRYFRIAEGLEKVYDVIGHNTMRDNIKTFFAVIDECFDIQNVKYASIAPHLKLGFLTQLARLFLDHQDFWDDASLVVSHDWRRKLGLFKVNDPTIAAYCSGNGKVQIQLYHLLVEHMNKGRRTKALTPFEIGAVAYEDESLEDEAA